MKGDPMPCYLSEYKMNYFTKMKLLLKIFVNKSANKVSQIEFSS